jgi:hypothetical protein
MDSLDTTMKVKVAVHLSFINQRDKISSHLEDVIDTLVVAAFDLLFLDVGGVNVLLLFNGHFFLELHELVLELVLIFVHLVVASQHLVHHIALHFQVHHLVTQIFHLIQVHLLHGLSLSCDRPLQTLKLNHS